MSDIELFCRTAFGAQDRLNKIPPVPYREVQLPSKLRFGYYTSGTVFPVCQDILLLTTGEDDYVKASPANRRAVLETVAALKEKGHECVEFQVPQRKRLKKLGKKITFYIIFSITCYGTLCWYYFC